MTDGSSPSVSVVVATRDRPERLAALLATLRRQTLPAGAFEVIVVDDASGPETPRLLAAEAGRPGPELRVIRRETPGGPGGARNDGWRAARGAFVAFTDDDCIVEPGWLEAALAAAEGRENRIVQGPTTPDPAEAGRLSPFTHTLQIERLGPWFETCNILYPRALLEATGGFDAAGYPVCGEDTDLAWRAIAAGGQPVWAPAMQAHHAVVPVGPAGRLRIAWRWHGAIKLFATHPALKDHLALRVFWRPTHLGLARLALALVLPRRLWPLSLWLAAPYLTFLCRRRTGPLLAPWLIAHDLVEIAACVRGSARYRTLVL